MRKRGKRKEERGKRKEENTSSRAFSPPTSSFLCPSKMAWCGEWSGNISDKYPCIQPARLQPVR
jgi:hypothetical protein